MDNFNHIKTTREYHSWSSMNDRCENCKATSFERYGAKGINVCDNWSRSKLGTKGYLNFVKDLGPRPEGTTLDRIENSKGYSKENCKWSTYKEQARNKSSNKKIIVKGECKTVAEWSEILGTSLQKTYWRLNKGWTVEESLGLKEKITEYTPRIKEEDLYFIQSNIDILTKIKIAEVLGVHRKTIENICKKFDIKKNKRI